MIANLTISKSTASEFEYLATAAKAPRVRTIRRFAEDEIVIPDGKFEGERFRVDRQPYTGLYLDAVDSGLWPRISAVGVIQSGKSLIGYCTPAVYHLFEMRETVILQVPHMDMAAEKWMVDLLPLIERTRYRDLLPKAGTGSRGGFSRIMQMGNGAILRFMSFGGQDKSRSGSTARVIVATEVDGADAASEASVEADKMTQIEGRTGQYGEEEKLIYKECTVSVASGHIWTDYTNGTESRIVLPCPHCLERVLPERENLVGWQDAVSDRDAARSAFWSCPACGEAWSEEERRQANLGGVLVHHGQQIDKRGRISGDARDTFILGFRWGAVHNLFVTAGDLGAEEWRASRAADEENAEKKMRQQKFAIPYEPPEWQITPLQREGIVHRTLKGHRKGRVPEHVEWLTVGVDLGKYRAHWTAGAWLEDSGAHVADYSVFEIPTDQVGLEAALLGSLRQFRDQLLEGFTWRGEENRVPDQVLIDAGYMPDVVYALCRESGERFRPCLGRGSGQYHRQRYARPKNTSKVVPYVGEGFHVTTLPKAGVYVVEYDADYWKSKVHELLSTPLDQPGAMTLHEAMPREHYQFARHITAERQVEEFVVGKGNTIRWEKVYRQNHWLDSTSLAAIGASLLGWRVVREEIKERPKRQPQPQRTSEGRAFVASQR